MPEAAGDAPAEPAPGTSAADGAQAAAEGRGHRQHWHPHLHRRKEGEGAPPEANGAQGGSPRGDEAGRGHRHRGDRREAAEAAKRDAAARQRHLAATVNLRDVGLAAGGDRLTTGLVYRSSQLLSGAEMARLGVRTILDLRQMDRPCKRALPRTTQARKALYRYFVEDVGRVVLWALSWALYWLLCLLWPTQQLLRGGTTMIVPEPLQLYKTRGHPRDCDVCVRRLHDQLDFEAAHVVHADLVPTYVGLEIFRRVPGAVKLHALGAACTGKGASSVMAGAVADPRAMGYQALYRLLLEDSRRGIARALRVFVDPANLPVLIHCIHGKDRTGLIVMLLLLLCDIEAEAIVEDYMRSEVVLKQNRAEHHLNLDVYLTTDTVIAASRDTMEATLRLVQEKLGGIRAYVASCGLEDWEVARIRLNLMQKADPADEQHRDATGIGGRPTALSARPSQGPQGPGQAAAPAARESLGALDKIAPAGPAASHSQVEAAADPLGSEEPPPAALGRAEGEEKEAHPLGGEHTGVHTASAAVGLHAAPQG